MEQKFWTHLARDMIVMIGLPGKAAGRPMTAQLRGDRNSGPIWFFTAKDTDLGDGITSSTKAEMVFVSKGFDLFATVHGTIEVETDRAVLDDLWNGSVAAWFEGGKDDPKLQLLRLDPSEAEIWLNASSVIAGTKMMLGIGDRKEDYKATRRL
ncbi:pyridoxamine 5'-phosphate oxidase family protein [Pararhodobacter oceanensis]|uniref:pyridoxamine 5'-phosphate oxidase family protein n=1 Tax=Pararhodobacter oceanensis TaxID=2172121 RepID=UPI0023E848CD|nr:pyridoxamine 5'-phosphate oxidase family protein [Pararhodobacter oceanensis]